MDGWTDNELDNQTKILNEKQNQMKKKNLDLKENVFYSKII